MVKSYLRTPALVSFALLLIAAISVAPPVQASAVAVEETAYDFIAAENDAQVYRRQDAEIGKLLAKPLDDVEDGFDTIAAEEEVQVYRRNAEEEYDTIAAEEEVQVYKREEEYDFIAAEEDVGVYKRDEAAASTDDKAKQSPEEQKKKEGEDEKKKGEDEKKKEEENKKKEEENKKKEEEDKKKSDEDKKKTDEEKKKADEEKKKEQEKLKDSEKKKEAEKKMTPEERMKKRPAVSKMYKVDHNLFATPKSHPGLFSFTGRWLAHRDTFAASSWPGTSVKMLIYGSECTIKLRATRPNGTVSDHRFYVSVDSPKQYVLSLPPYDATNNSVFDVRLDLNEINKSLNISSQPPEIQYKTSHVVEIMSDENTPFEFLGVSMVAHQVLRQGNSWANAENKIPHVEFISDKLSTETADLNRTALYTASRDLGLRASYVHLYDRCFSEHCTTTSAGLNVQYNWLSPFGGNPYPEDARMAMPTHYLFNPEQVLFPTSIPQYIIVDVGDNDLAHNVQSAEFMSSLQMFLGNIVINTNPNAHILVIVRDERYVVETEDAIYSMKNPRITAIKFGQDTHEWHKALLCKYVGASADHSTDVFAKCEPYLKYSAFDAKPVSVPSVIWTMFGISAVAVMAFSLLKHRQTIDSFFKSTLSSYSQIPTKSYSDKV